MKYQVVMMAVAAAMLSACGGGGSAEMASDLNTLDLHDGRKVMLLPEGFAGTVYRSEDASYRKVIGNNVQSARYGWVVDKEKGGYHSFYKGEGRGDVPAAGVFAYQGIALHREGGSAIYETKADFTVDFGEKHIVGQIGGEGLDAAALPVRATIAGDDFTGAAHGVSIRGGFFGHNAAEMAGSYESLNHAEGRSFSGVFGAKR